MQKQVAINQLTPGMRVVQLDIGWQKIPQWQKPFIVQTAEDIVRLHQHCKSVVVELPENDPVALPPSPTKTTGKEQTSEPTDSSEQKIYGVPDQSINTLKDKISVSFAIDSYQQTLEVLSRTFDQIRQGHSFGGKGLHECSKNLLLSAHAHPEILTLICNLKEKQNAGRTTSLEQKSLDVAVLSLMFGKALNLKNAELHQLALAALLHDIGMLRLPQELLNQQEKLSLSQAKLIQKHVEYSCRILSRKEEFKPLVGLVAYHHERYDGKGYPAGVKAAKTPLPARILQITTVFEALTRDRQYSDQHSTTNALSKLYSWRNKALDGKLVESFIKTIGVYPVGTLVRLNNDYTGIVTEVHSAHRSRPTIELLFDRSGEAILKSPEINLTEQKHKKLQITKSLDPDEFPEKVLDTILKRLKS